jgi:hypothetical protein
VSGRYTPFGQPDVPWEDVSADTEALLATVREALDFDLHAAQHMPGGLRAIPDMTIAEMIRKQRDGYDALDSLAAELERLRKGLKIEGEAADANGRDARAAEARLDKALTALRAIAEGNVPLPHEQVAAVTLAEIEEEAT